MSKKVERLCVFCRHFDLSTGSIDTFDEEAGNMYCNKNHWDSDRIFPSATENDLRSVIFTAETCPDYEQVRINKGIVPNE